MSPVLVDSSVVVRAVLERGLPRAVARAVAASSALVVSRLALVETARALDRAQAEGRVTNEMFAKAQEQVAELFGRCEIWEVSRSVCDAAGILAPRSGIRTLDAIHLATFLAARKRLPSLKLLTTDQRLRDVAMRLGLRTIAT
jgi:predicted nucleic acid-binding protein